MAVVGVRVRMMDVAVVVAMLGIVVVLTVVSVGVVVHLVHPLHFTRARYLALAFWANFAVIQTDGSTVLFGCAAHRVARDGKTRTGRIACATTGDSTWPPA